MYIANYLGQDSVVFGPGFDNTLEVEYDAAKNEGSSTFVAKVCIDRREIYGLIECDPGHIYVNIDVVEVCKGKNAD